MTMKKLSGLVHVALRKESVDRNSWAARARVAQYWSLSARRAWIEIRRASGAADIDNRSLSARRAWIEIFISREISLMRPVALRKESVDRNDFPGADLVRNAVALRKESVDRNRVSCQQPVKA